MAIPPHRPSRMVRAISVRPIDQVPYYELTVDQLDRLQESVDRTSWYQTFAVTSLGILVSIGTSLYTLKVKQSGLTIFVMFWSGFICSAVAFIICTTGTIINRVHLNKRFNNIREIPTETMLGDETHPMDRDKFHNTLQSSGTLNDEQNSLKVEEKE